MAQTSYRWFFNHRRSAKLQAASSGATFQSLTSFKLQDIMGVEREGNMIIDRTPTEGAVRISSTINNHLVTRVYYFMTKKEAVQSFKEEFNEKENRP